MLLMVAGFLAGSLPVAFDAEAAGSKSKDEVAGSDKDKKAEKARDEDALGDTLQTGRPVFSSVEKELIRDFFGGLEPDASGDLPYGLAKRDELPPGLQKHIEKYGTLPPRRARSARDRRHLRHPRGRAYAIAGPRPSRARSRRACPR
jgi:hypothetical protein